MSKNVFYQILLHSDGDESIKEQEKLILQCEIFLIACQTSNTKMSLTKMEQQTEQSQPPSSLLSIENTYLELSNTEDPQKMDELAQVIISYLCQAQGYELQACLQLILKVISKGYVELLTKSTLLLTKIMTHFVQLSKTFRTLSSPQLQYRKLFTLSILAEIVRQEPNFQMPFSHDFLKELFEIQVDEVEYEVRGKLLTLLGVLYSNLGKQSTLLRERKMGHRLKEAVLENYSFIEDKFTAKLFNQCIIQLQTRKLAKFSLLEIQRYGIKSALIETVGKGKKEVIEQYLEKLFGKKRS